MSHVQQITKPKYSPEAVEALMKKTAIEAAEGSYITPIPGGNGNTFIKEAKEVVSKYLNRFITDPNTDKEKAEASLRLIVKSRKWSPEEMSDVFNGARSAVRTLEEQRDFLVKFDKDKSPTP